VSSYTTGLLAAVSGAVLYGSAPVAQAVAAAGVAKGSGLGVRLTLRLARRPLWLAGLLADIGGFVLEAFAFSQAPTTLVAPIMACDMVVFVVLCWPAFGERPSCRGAAGAGLMAAAVALLALTFGNGPGLGTPAGDATLFGFLAAAVAAAAVGGRIGSRSIARGRPTLAAGAFSAACGICFGLATLTTRQVGRTFSPDDPWQLLATPTPYVLAACSVLAITMMQRALQTGPVLAFPVTSALSAFVPVIIGAALLGDRVPAGWGRPGFALALVLVGCGVALLGADRSAAEARTSERP
jgi:drug/metabolite transporter (DMT)-like permease